MTQLFDLSGKIALVTRANTGIGHVPPANRKEDHVDRRAAKRTRTGERRVLIALRERYGRTIPFVGKLESEGVNIARGKYTNWVESYFARLREMIGGQHHWVRS